MAAINSSSGLSPFVPLQGARPTDAQQPASSPTSGAAQRALTAAAARPAMAYEARPTRGTFVAANDSQHRALDAATDRSAAQAKDAKKYTSVAAKVFKFGVEAPLGKAYETLDKVGLKLGLQEVKALGAKATKSFLGFMAAVPLAIADWRANRNAGQQAAQYKAGAENFKAQCAELTAISEPQARADARTNLYGMDRDSGAQATDAAQAWLKHKDASRKGNALGVGLGAATSLHSATDTGINIAYEASKTAAKSLKNALPFVGVAGAAIGLATSAHALKKQMGVRTELNAQKEQLAAASQQLKGAEGQASMEGALANVFKASQARLEVRATTNNIQMAGSGLALAGNASALAGNVLTASGVGLVAAAGLAVTSMALSLMSLCASIGATLYEHRKTSADAGEKSAITPDQLNAQFKGLEGEALDLAKADLAGKNKFYALVHLAEKLQTANPASPEFLKAENLLGTAGLSGEHVQALITLIRANPGEIDIRSAGVNELAKALYGAPVGEVAGGAAEVEVAEASEAAAVPLQAQSSPPANALGSLYGHSVMMA